MLKRILRSHPDAEVLSIIEDDDSPFLQLRTFSAGQTVAIQVPAPVPFASAEAIDIIEAQGDGEAGEGGTFSVQALAPVRALLGNHSGVNRLQVRTMADNGPLVIDTENATAGWSLRVVVMACGEKGR